MIDLSSSLSGQVQDEVWRRRRKIPSSHVSGRLQKVEEGDEENDEDEDDEEEDDEPPISWDPSCRFISGRCLTHH